MNPWEIVAQEDRTSSESRRRLVLLRSPETFKPYKVYALDGEKGYWELKGRFDLPGTNGTETPEWALGRAWAQIQERGLQPVLRHSGKA